MIREITIFISYAHADNRTWSPDKPGWVELLHRYLDILLPQLLGARLKITIWRDHKLLGNDDFGPEILRQIKRSTFFVPVLSPSYVSSRWCLRELRKFCRAAAANHAWSLNEKSRIFKVIKTSISDDEHPKRLQRMLGYNFFETGAIGSKPTEFDPDPDSDPKYKQKLYDLAYEIKFLIERMSNEMFIQPAPAASLTSETVVYLAQTTSDLEEERDKIKRELMQHKYVVLPDQALPSNSAVDLQTAIHSYLKRSRLSIHMLGRNYGQTPEDDHRSIVHWQHELALESGLTNLVWIPSGLEPTDDRQRQFIEQLHANFSPRNDSELLEVKIEDLKTVIHARLNPQPTKAPNSTDDRPTLLYLVCDEQDDEAAHQLENHLFDQGLEVLRLTKDADQEHRVNLHRDHQLLCDAILVFCQKAGERWLQTMRIDLLKLRGIRDRPILAKPLYLFTGEQTQYKDQFRTNEGDVIRMYGGFVPSEQLARYIARLKKEKLNRVKMELQTDRNERPS